MNDSFDTVVIGSGFGGSVVACRLAEAGCSVCILERGKHFPKGRFFEDLFRVARRSIWNKRRRRWGYIEFREFRNIEIIQGCGVGGGSLHYYNVTVRPEADIFTPGNGWPAEITYAELEQYFDRVEKMLDVNRIDGARDVPHRMTAFLNAVSSAGAAPAAVPLAVNFDTDASGEVPCDYRGRCLTGCNIKGKNSLDQNYLRIARACGAHIEELAEVELVEPDGADGYRVTFRKLESERIASLRCPRVILAAGALGSTELLLRCREQGTLDRLSPRLGQEFSGNGDYLYAGTLLRRDVFPTRGPSITCGATFEQTGGERHFVEDLGIADALTPLLGATINNRGHQFLDNFLRPFLRGEFPCRITVPEGTVTSSTFLRQVDRFLPYLAMGAERQKGEMSLVRNGSDWHLDISWPYLQNLPLYEKQRDLLRYISQTSGGQFVDSLWGQEAIGPSGRTSAFTAHPLGGCVMGTSPQDGVVNHRGEVFGYEGKNLYVVDGAIVASCLIANPSLTIAALAERIAALMPARIGS